MNEKGYYCIIQYRESIIRSETVNLGVLLFSDALNYIRMKIDEKTKRLKNIGLTSKEDANRLRYWIKSLLLNYQNWINSKKGIIKSIDDINTLTGHNANEIILTEPRWVKITKSPDDVLIDLFNEIVKISKNTDKKNNEPLERIKKIFESRRDNDKIWFNTEETIPYAEIPMKFKFAFGNNKNNLVHPIGFSKDNDFHKTFRFAAEFSAIIKESKKRKIIHVPFDIGSDDEIAYKHVDIFRKNQIKPWLIDQYDEFEREVESQISS